MNTITVNREELIKAAIEAFEYAGDFNWFLCVDPDGTPDVYNNSHNSYKESFVLTSCETLGFEDGNGNYPSDAGYDFEAAAAWLIDEMDLNLTHEKTEWSEENDDLIATQTVIEIKS
jgi:hypothetical protein